MSRKVRPYCEGDKQTLVDLWNRVYASCGGYVPRTALHWEWCILQRPGVGSADVMILEAKDTVKAYAVLGPKGQVLEMAVESTLSWGNRYELAVDLREALEERARARGHDMIKFAAPSTDTAVCEAFRHGGFREETGDFLNMTIVNPVALLRNILHNRMSKIPKDWAPSFQIELASGHYRFSPCSRIYIDLRAPLVVEETAPLQRADYTVHTNLSVLTDLIFSRATFESSAEARSIIVEPVSGEAHVRMLISLMLLKLPWYSPYADAQ